MCVANTNQCPPGTFWNGQYCFTNTTKCPAGTFWNGVSCQLFQGQCPNNMNFVNGQCVPSNGNCPVGTYFSNGVCQPHVPCSGGRIWNSNYYQCICPIDSFWNGLLCIKCLQSQIY